MKFIIRNALGMFVKNASIAKKKSTKYQMRWKGFADSAYSYIF